MPRTPGVPFLLAQPGAALSRLVACQGDAVHHPSMAVIVVDGVVHGTAVVPEGQRPHLPAEAAGEFRPGLVLPQEPEQRQAFALGPSLDVRCMRARSVERLATGLGMRAHDGML